VLKWIYDKNKSRIQEFKDLLRVEQTDDNGSKIIYVHVYALIPLTDPSSVRTLHIVLFIVPFPTNTIEFSIVLRENFERCLLSGIGLVVDETELNGISARWNYLESGHDKGACDGLGTTVKRSAEMDIRQK
jgi:hypothetical protein